MIYGDQELARKRLALAPEEGLDKAPAWLYEGMARAFREGAARLAVSGSDPKALEGLPPEKVGRAQKANARAYKPALGPSRSSSPTGPSSPSPTPAGRGRSSQASPRRRR